MKQLFTIVSFLVIVGLPVSTWAAKGAIPEDYHGIWATGGRSQLKYHLHVEGSGMQMYGPDRRTPLGNRDVRKLESAGKGIRIVTPETNSQKPTHMKLQLESKDHLSFTVDMGGNGGTDQLESCK